MEPMTTAVLVFLLAGVCELVDAFVGMGYGTILSPVLLIYGYSPLQVVPAILLSQACGGLIATLVHHRYENIDLVGNAEHRRIYLVLTALTIVGIVLGVAAGVKLPKKVVATYIALVVLAMGVVITSGVTLDFTMGRAAALGLVSAWNKAISGGGFGPVMTGGNLITGRDSKEAVGYGVSVEVPVCLTSFVLYLASNVPPDPALVAPMCVGAMVGAPIGARQTALTDTTRLKRTIGVLLIALGVWALVGGSA